MQQAYNYQQNTIGTKTITETFGLFIDLRAQFIVQEQGPRSSFAIGGLNKMPKAFLARAAGTSVLGGSGGMLSWKIFEINASIMAKNTSQYSRHSEFFFY